MAAKHILGHIRKRKAAKRPQKKQAKVKIKVSGSPAQVFKAVKKIANPNNDDKNLLHM